MNLAKAEKAHQSGDFHAAKKFYQLALNDNANDAGALYGLGTIALQEKRLQDAARLLQDAARLEPAAADIALNLAVTFHRLGNKSSAVDSATQAAQLALADIPFSNRVCQLLLKLNQPHSVLSVKSRQREEKIAGSPTSQIQSQIIVARAYGLLGEWDTAVSMLKNLAQVHQQQAEILHELSLAAARLRDYPLAIDSFRQYMGHVNSGLREHVRLADLYQLARDKEGMAAQLAEAEKLGANDVEFHLLRARLARLDNNLPTAIEHCLTALEQQEDHGAVWSLMLEMSNPAGTEQQLDRLYDVLQRSESNPNNQASLYFAYAGGLQKVQRYAAAFGQYVKANLMHRRDLAERDIVYSADKAEQQLSKTTRYFTKACVGKNKIRGPVSPIFIVGMPRSGTTLMEKMLAQLEPVTAGGELESLSFAATQYQIDVNNRVKPLPADMSGAQWQEIAKQYYARVPQSSEYLTDKLPHNFNNVGLALALFPEAKIIQMRRDPRDVCLSIFSHQFPDGHAYACDFDSLAHAYMISQRLMDHWVEVAPNQVLDVSYEELATHPETSGRAAIEFCGFDWHERCLDFHATTSASFTFSELQVREGVHRSRIGRWQLYEDNITTLCEALQKYGVLP